VSVAYGGIYCYRKVVLCPTVPMGYGIINNAGLIRKGKWAVAAHLASTGSMPTYTVFVHAS